MKQEKRGQFFIIFAVILGIIILGLATVFNTAIRTGREGITEKKFNTMCQNYKEETYRVSQYAINTTNKSNESGLIKDFTIKYLNYAKKTDPAFGLVYIYGNVSKVIIFNSTTTQAETILNPPNPYPVQISEKINKEYELSNDERFWFVAITEKDGEEYVCE